jgi:hypothetical protein
MSITLGLRCLRKQQNPAVTHKFIWVKRNCFLCLGQVPLQLYKKDKKLLHISIHMSCSMMSDEEQISKATTIVSPLI